MYNHKAALRCNWRVQLKATPAKREALIILMSTTGGRKASVDSNNVWAPQRVHPSITITQSCCKQTSAFNPQTSRNPT